MKFAGLLLTTLLSLNWGAYGTEEICRIYTDKFDRAALFSRNFLVGDSNRWPDATVPYKIADGFTASDIEKIKGAMALIEGSTCVKFVEHTNQKSHVKIFTGGSGCYANLGYSQWRSESVLHLQRESYCMRTGTIAHEMLHILGFAHEHTRPDRDEHLKINWNLLSSNSVSNWFRCGGENESPLPPTCDPKDPAKQFDKCFAGFRTSTFGLEYDYGSVMHYGLNAGSPGGEAVMTTLKTVPSGVSIGQRGGPSVTDFNKVNKAYPCGKKVTTVTTEKPCDDYYSNCKDLTAHCATSQNIKNGCKRSCGICDGIIPTTPEPPCDDYYTNCKDLTAHCATDQNIKNGCKRSCGICDGIIPTTPEPPCEDLYTNCGDYKSYCTTWDVIKTGCKETCGLCP